MELKECYIGKIVQKRISLKENEPDTVNLKHPSTKEYVSFPETGHITGLSHNWQGEILLEVKFFDGRKFPIHPANLISLKDY